MRNGLSCGWVMVAVLVSACSALRASSDPLAAAQAAALTITAETLAVHIRTLSGDAFEGRGTATAGDEKTRRYLIEQLQSLGFEPGGPDGSWEQAFDVIGVQSALPPQWSFRAGGGSLVLRPHEEFVATSGVQQATAALNEAEVVFAGYGIRAPEQQWDDFKGVDLRGKLLLVLNNDPDWDPGLFAGTRRLYYGRWTYKYEEAARQGAEGALIIHTTPSAGYPWSVVQTSWAGEQFSLPALDEPRLQVTAWITEDAARRLVGLAGRSLDDLVAAARRRDFRPVRLGVRTSLQLTNTLRRARTANVLGLLRGRDPQLARQALVYSAHFDHLGIGPPDARGDRIYNGAVDNASGVAALLGIARAIRSLPQPPRRSVLMFFPAAEEQGLLGSAAWAARPGWPAGQTVANLNYDGMNTWGRTRDITLIGLGKSSLDEAARRVAHRQGRIVLPDQFPDRGYYYRSDHFNLAKIGVPALSIEEGIDVIGRPAGWGRAQKEAYEAERYHQPSDEFDETWNLDGMVEDARFGFLMGILIANDDNIPTWVPGDEFEAARRR